MTAPPPPVVPGPPAPIPHWYFTGYSEQEVNFPLVRRFHDDVQSQVRGVLGKHMPGQGFVDFKDITAGERWEERVVRNGVCTTRAMLVLYSPSYFHSRWCAREWTVFTAREKRYRDGGGTVPCLIGVLWQRGTQEWPDAVNAFQYVRRTPDTTYEKHGLLHLVPYKADDPGSDEYRGIVREVAALIADAHRARIPAIAVEETTGLRPPFGPESLLPVDYVVAYTAGNRDWGQWAYVELERLGTVDALELHSGESGHPERLRQALRRANRVVLLVSRHSLTTGDLTKDTLDAAYADQEFSLDLPRLVPFFIEHVSEEAVPEGFRPLLGNALYGIPDASAVQEILVAAVTAPVHPSAAATEEDPAAPSDVRAVDRALVDNLVVASSVRDPVIRALWLERTAIPKEAYPDPTYPLRVWLFKVLAACESHFGGYEPLATALEDLELGSSEALRVRKLVSEMAAAGKE
ncbi:TIR domain-containing protein [Streptomyces sp. NPDC001595]|uniref:TIR domain-containing protein n=1 Tax=Streptomyces sp. NPDC001532 TaxID=3154520 RepID=UPI0033203D12